MMNLKIMLGFADYIGTCYADPELRTLTMDVGFFISADIVNKDEDQVRQVGRVVADRLYSGIIGR